MARKDADDVSNGVCPATDPATLGLDALAAFVRASTDGIIFMDADRRCVYANRTACELLGHPADRVMGRDCLTFVPERERSTASMLFACVAGAGGVAVYRPDGSERDIEARTTSLDLPGRQLTALVLRDMSERHRRAREAAAIAQAATSAAVSDSIDAVVQTVADGVVRGTGALASWVTFGEEDDDAAWVGAAGAPSGFRDCVRAAARTGAHRAALMQAVMAQRLVVYADARRQVEREPSMACVAAALKSLPWQMGVMAPLVYRDAIVGILIAIYPAGALPTEAETTFLAAMADQAAMAAANARLMLAACDKVALEERKRLAHELHDSASQALYGIEVEAVMVGERLDHVRRLAEAGQAAMRALIFELRPGSLEAEGLVACLNRQIEAVRSQHGVAVHALAAEEPEAPMETKEALYKIAQEALRNAVKHARPRRVDVSLEAETGRLVLEVVDDGAGFDPHGRFPGHLGLRSMRERALAVNGSLDVISARGRGTRVVARVPAGGS